MTFSVNTNPGALIALQTLGATQSQLNVTQNRINTGLKVASAKDDAATYAIAQKLRSDISGLNAVKTSLDRASGLTDVSLAAGEAVSDLLLTMKEKAVAAKDAGLDNTSRSKLDDEYQQLLKQVDSIVSNATFNGKNFVKASGDNVQAITEGSATPANNILLTATNLSTAGLTISGGDLTSSTNAATALGKISAAITTVSSALSKLGAVSKRIDLQKTFVSKLSDTIDTGIGNLVDADLAKESARLQSLQVKQQLGLQALSIANQAPSSVLSLFR